MNDSLAQLVEQLTLNQWVEGSNPSGVTKGGRNSTLFCAFMVGMSFIGVSDFFFGGRCGCVVGPVRLVGLVGLVGRVGLFR